MAQDLQLACAIRLHTDTEAGTVGIIIVETEGAWFGMWCMAVHWMCFPWNTKLHAQVMNNYKTVVVRGRCCDRYAHISFQFQDSRKHDTCEDKQTMLPES